MREKVIVRIKKTNDQVWRLTAGPNLQRNKPRRKRRGLRADRGRERWEAQAAGVEKLRMCSAPSRLTATPSPYQTFQRQRGWLQALSG